MHFRCRDPDATEGAARALARALVEQPGRGLTLGLAGPLGAGKTHFVKGLAAGLGIDPGEVSSPTFVIVNQYRAGERLLAHVDLYRLQSAEELEDAGFLDLLLPAAVVAVEWADRFPEALPGDRLELGIERHAADQDSRSLTASATGEGSREVLALWRGHLEKVPGVSVDRTTRQLANERSEPREES